MGNGTLGGQKISNGKKNDTTTWASSATIFSLPTGASPYTGMGAVISIRVVIKSFLNEIDTGNSSTNKTINDNEAEMVLDEYGDLNSLLVHGENELQDGSGFRIVLERYSIALVRDHIVRLRSLLGGNSPNSVSLDEGGGGGGADGGADDIESSPSNEKETKRRRDEG